jgi:hypothetical protein
VGSACHRAHVQWPNCPLQYIRGTSSPTFLHFSPFSVFCINMTFAVLFQKMDPNLGAIIIGVEPSQSAVNSIGANQSYVDANVAGGWGRRRPLDFVTHMAGVSGQDLWRRPPLYWHHASLLPHFLLPPLLTRAAASPAAPRRRPSCPVLPLTIQPPVGCAAAAPTPLGHVAV